jgi:hypothetical protein
MSIRPTSSKIANDEPGAGKIATFIGKSECRSKRLLARQSRGPRLQRLVSKEFPSGASTGDPADLAHDRVLYFTMARADSAPLPEGLPHG